MSLTIDEVDTLGAIAPRVGLAPNALGNLARRQTSFPSPVAVFGKAAVYEVAAVLDWVGAWKILHST